MTHDTTVHVPLVRQASVFLQRVPQVTSTSELFWLEVCRFLLKSRVVCLESLCSSAKSSTPTQGRVPAACRAATLPRTSAANMPKARLHSGEPSTSPCSAPRSFGIGGSPSCSTKDKFRCFHATAAVCLGRNRAQRHPECQLRSAALRS